MTKKRWKEPRLSKEKIAELALGIFTGEVFTSDQIPERDFHLLPMIFMPLFFCSEEQRKEWKQHPPVLFYGWMRDAGPNGINHYPIFSRFGMIYKQDAGLIREKYEKLKAAAREILK